MAEGSCNMPVHKLIRNVEVLQRLELGLKNTSFCFRLCFLADSHTYIAEKK